MRINSLIIPWFSIVFGIVFVAIAFGSMYVYYLMRQVTVSTERFELIPCYIIALQLLLCGAIQFLLGKSTFRNQTAAVRFAAMIFGIALVLLIVGLVSVLWLAEKQDSFTVCVLNPQLNNCACRRDINTKSSYGWYVYDRMNNCRNLDTLFHLMIITMVLYASAAFCCFLSILYLYVIWLKNKEEQDSRQISEEQGHANDWDSWIFNHPRFRRMFAELRHHCYPPTYDDSQRQIRREARQIQRNNEPPPPYEHHPVEQRRQSPKIHNITVVEVTNE